MPVRSSKKLFPSTIILRLLKEAQGIPIIFSIVSNSSLNIIFEEFCDANVFFNWNNPIAIENPLEFNSEVTVNQQLQAYHAKHTKKYGYRVPKPAIDPSSSTADQDSQAIGSPSEQADGTASPREEKSISSQENGENVFITDEDIAILADIAVRLTPLPELEDNSNSNNANTHNYG
jgi:hypothetical protein